MWMVGVFWSQVGHVLVWVDIHVLVWADTLVMKDNLQVRVL